VETKIYCDEDMLGCLTGALPFDKGHICGLEHCPPSELSRYASKAHRTW
jgi:hypothetical protein